MESQPLFLDSMYQGLEGLIMKRWTRSDARYTNAFACTRTILICLHIISGTTETISLHAFSAIISSDRWSRKHKSCTTDKIFYFVKRIFHCMWLPSASFPNIDSWFLFVILKKKILLYSWIVSFKNLAIQCFHQLFSKYSQLYFTLALEIFSR